MDGCAFPNGITSFEASRQIRFMTAGSVDDGKSTLIGRLLYDSRRVFDDQLQALQRDSRQFGKHFTALVKYAHYNGAGAPFAFDKDVFWAQLEFNF